MPPSEAPEILLDVDGTCLGSIGEFNVNLFNALKAMGIKKVNILSSFEMPNLGMVGEENNFRCLVIDKLNEMGIQTGYVIVNASPYLDFDDKGKGRLGNYYHNTIEKFERKILKFRRKYQNVDLDSTETKKLNPLIKREQNIMAHEALQKAEDSGATEEEKGLFQKRITDENDKKKVNEVKNKLNPKTESLPNSSQFTGGKERMILHVIRHSETSQNFIIFDDKLQVNNTVQEMDSNSELFPETNGRMHAVRVNMKDKKQTEDYYIRKLIQGYSISQLKQFVENHSADLKEKKDTLLSLLNSIPQDQEIKEKQKGIYAQLILACWHPHDIENIVELYQKLSKEENVSESMKSLFDNVMEEGLKNPILQGKILNAIPNDKIEKEQGLINQIKSKTLEYYEAIQAKNPTKWQHLVKQISENPCKTSDNLLLLRSSIQLGLAMEGKQDIEDLAKLMTDLNQEQEKNPIIVDNIRSAIENTAYYPKKYLELLKYYREFGTKPPQKEIIEDYLTPDAMKKNLESLTSLNPPQPQPWQFIGYPVLKDMLSKLGGERDLIYLVNQLEKTEPKGSPEIASLMISLIAGYTDVHFYPAKELPQIHGIDTKKYQLTLLLQLCEKDPETINKIKNQFIENKDLESCLFLIDGIKDSMSMSAENKRTLITSLSARIDNLLESSSYQVPTRFDSYHIDYKAQEILKTLQENNKKIAVLKHAALCSLSEIAKELTQEKTTELISKLNKSLETISSFQDDKLTHYAKESVLEATRTLMPKIDAVDQKLKQEVEKLFDNCLTSSIDCFNYLKNNFPSESSQKCFASIARDKAQEKLKKTVTNNELVDYVNNNQDQATLRVIAYADYVSQKEKPNLSEIIELAVEINTLSKKLNSPLTTEQEELLNKLKNIQRTTFNKYLDHLVYNKNSEVEITNLQYFQDKKDNDPELKEVLDAAQAVLSDKTRLPETKTDVLKAMARTAQVMADPSDTQNKNELAKTGKKFKFTPSLNLLGKAILVAVSTLAAGIGLFITGGIVANQTTKDSRLYKALYQKIKPPNEPESNTEQIPKVSSNFPN